MKPVNKTDPRIVKARPYSRMLNPVGWYDAYMVFLKGVAERRKLVLGVADTTNTEIKTKRHVR